MSDNQKEQDQTETPQKEVKEKKLLDPVNSTIYVSLKKNLGSDLFIGKLILKKFGHLELNGLGRATSRVVQIAESLERNNFAKINKVESYIKEMSDMRSQSGTRNEIALKICLEKSEQFDELTKGLE